MSDLLQEVQRWQKLERAAASSDRWTGWAQSMIGRYGRLLPRHHGVAMTLAQPPELLYMSCQQWEHAAWTLCPQINLAISPILRQTVWRGAPTLPMAQARLVSPKPPSPIGQRAPTQQAGAGQALDDNLPAVHPPAEHQTLVFPAPDPGWHAPLKRVFARTQVEDVHESVTVSHVTRESLFERQSLQILRRVVEERQRVEAWVRGTIVTRQQQEWTSVVTAAQAREVVTHSPRGPRVGAPGMAQVASSPSVDIEQLTDQVVRHIDRRIVAHRERMGKAF
jgi:hypothetical protein